MKKTVIVGFIVTVVGIFLFALGLGNGGARTVYWDHGFTTDQYSRVKSHQVTKSYSGIKNFSLATASRVQIKKGNVSKTEITYPSATKVTKSGDTLHMNLKSQPKRHGVVFFGDFDQASHLFGKTIITVPKNTQIGTITSDVADSISVKNMIIKTITSSGVGDVTLDHVTTTADLDLENTGDVTLKSSRFPNAHLDVGAGDVTLTSNKFDSMSVETGAGDINFNPQKVGKSLTAHSDVGDISGHVAKNKRAQISVSADVGDASLFGSSHKKHIESTAKNPIVYKFTSDVGDVTIHEG
ncbi:DUF4097 family beta strand repeat-containing protein [Lentilactobacillus otakiensis]|uniref:DUF4097 family beta strand repeat-containing protein n=1 Tax=Lentilactobacillus otakiensis TaxID=481720 RepID=UPI0003F65053|nr:DUF4097 family beta strand repeat-containing protein [Lentilactobacillus otakiensis]KRL09777.1 hypothetical protein FD05_GL000758 [Lentilactobacillus otakiensis DSM 19908 = JCM 15040]MBZ3776123.1 DUF4097 domain-containing protein [Lentilactobacillus otakiensis]MDV3517128.1 DUF4097 family beta strand repeat-containing protein [Lentilactobacillus otakiensis]